MRRVLFLAVLAFGFCRERALLAGDDQPLFAFDQGADASAVLKEARKEAARWLPALPEVPAISRSRKSAELHAPGVYPPLSPLIQNNAVFRDAAAARDDARYKVLDPEILEPLEKEWAEINSIRSDLLAEAAQWDGDNEQLYRDGQALDRERAILEQRRSDLNAEIGRYNQRCTTRPLPPDEYKACIQWRDDLIRRRDILDADIADYNRRVETWNQRSSSIFKRRETAGSRIQGWEKKTQGWAQGARKAMDEGAGNTRVTFQAQGKEPPVQKSVAYNAPQPLCKEDGLRILDQLWALLTTSERAERDEAIEKAKDWIRSRPAEGVTAPPPAEQHFYNRNRRDVDARIDISVWRGKAFVTCPCCAK